MALDMILSVPDKSVARELQRVAMKAILQSVSNKKFYDPLAAVCDVHPEIVTWTTDDMKHKDDSRITICHPEGKSKIIGDINSEKFWLHLVQGT